MKTENTDDSLEKIGFHEMDIEKKMQKEISQYVDWLYPSSTCIHETAIVETLDIGVNTKVWAFSHICEGVSIGENCMIGEGVHIGKNVKIGDNCRIQNHSLIYEGVNIEDDVFIGPSTVTTNDLYPKVGKEPEEYMTKTHFKKGASIGAGSVILAGVTLGENCLIACGSIITKDVPSGMIYINGKTKPNKK